MHHGFWGQLGEALLMAAGMFWDVGWSLVLGFAISAVIQAVVSTEQMRRALGRDGVREIALATVAGAVSSSCSYASAAISRTLFKKGAALIPSLARMVEFSVLRLMHPLVSARLATLLHPLGAAVLAVCGPGAVAAFAVLHGAGNGLLTIAKGTLPLAIFGPAGYGLRTGILAAPARAAQAAAPLVFGLLIDRLGIGALAVSAGITLTALGALLVLRAKPAPATVIAASL